jgi:hypothetical protein
MKCEGQACLHFNRRKAKNRAYQKTSGARADLSLLFA